MSTNSDTMGASREPVFSEHKASSSSSSNSNYNKGSITRDGPVGGASTGSPAASTAATSSNYHRERSRYNPATGSGFNPPSKEDSGESRKNYNEQHPTTSVGIAPERIRTDSSGTSPGPGANGNGGETGIKGALAGIHGVGESIRGTVGAAIDSIFNDQNGISKNQAIAREGEWEVKTGQFSKSTKERERFTNT
ncbi:hypothetical protein PISL3812_08303 [Talaromyces islandicus]|uniref:Uncharacterized protein n=1 Tax=Talaromyces islandicus TaxID=28573 RepID=A0A0U1M6N4_TALIS|nr:hypothetical protein PISL3812_08303 [Talaromyces islandicus]